MTPAIFVSALDAATLRQLARGARTVEILKQPQYEPMPVERQVASIYAVTNGYLDGIPVERIREWEHRFQDFLQSQGADLMSGLSKEGTLSDELETKLKDAVGDFNDRFQAELGDEEAAA
jgi:F-type H+-transporting ATPase subunit alpha